MKRMLIGIMILLAGVVGYGFYEGWFVVSAGDSGHEANVTLAVTLEDRTHGRLLTRTLDARAGIENDDPASMAKAMGQALDDAVAQVADAVRLSLQAHRASFPQ